MDSEKYAITAKLPLTKVPERQTFVLHLVICYSSKMATSPGIAQLALELAMTEWYRILFPAETKVFTHLQMSIPTLALT
jgi:hypothetical protein